MKEKKKPTNSQKLDMVREKGQSTCSAYDCTGLIPSAVLTEAQEDSYEELYPFIPSQTDTAEDIDGRK